MATHPYISGAGNVTQMINHLRKNFPSSVNSETVKKLGLASNNESYVINALQFLNLIDSDSKRTDNGQSILATHKDEDFEKLFSEQLMRSYADLFELHGENAWTLPKDDLINFFRTSDKTSDAIGQRQANLFVALKDLAGKGSPFKSDNAPKSPRNNKLKIPARAPAKLSKGDRIIEKENVLQPNVTKEVGLNVKIEVNLPAGASPETYDAIFKSIKANLIG